MFTNALDPLKKQTNKQEISGERKISCVSYGRQATVSSYIGIEGMNCL